MSTHGVKYRCIHKERTGSVVTEYQIELLKDGYVGAVTPVKGSSTVGKLSYPRIDVTKLFDQPLQKGIATLELMISPNLAYDGEAILDEIFTGDETTFLMRIRAKVGAGSLNTLFTGFVINDLNETTDGEYNYTSTIYAKDLTRGAGITWPITDDRVTVLKTIADLLDELGLGLDIYTYTSFITSQTTDTNDYLAQIYNDRYALQQYAKTGDEDPEAITVEKALEWVLRSHKLFIRQIDGAWRIFHLSAFNDPENVMEWKYDSTGAAVSSSTKDFTVDVDRVSKFILPGGTRAKTKAYKSVEVKFNHRTKVSGLTLPNRIEITDTDFSRTQSVFISTGEQIIQVGAGNIGVECDTDVGPVTVEVEVDIDGSLYTKTALLSLVGELETIPGYYRWAGTIAYEFSPDDIDDGVKKVTFKKATAPGGVDFLGTIYDGVYYNVINDVLGGNSTYINYILSQSGNWSNHLQLDDSYFGDGPIVNSRAVLRYSTLDITDGIWQRRGTTTGYRNFHENTLKEVMDAQRGISDNFEGSLWGYYSALSVIQKDGKNLFFFGGELTIGSNTWDAQLTEIDLKTAVDDVFSARLKYSDPNSSDGVSGGSINPATGGSLTENIADGIYYRRDKLLSETPVLQKPTLRTNIGLGETDSPIFAGAAFNPAIAQAPFTLNVNAQGQLVTGLNAEELGGYKYDELPYDDYQNWTLTLNGAAPTILASTNTLNFVDSPDIAVSKDGNGDVQWTYVSDFATEQWVTDNFTYTASNGIDLITAGGAKDFQPDYGTSAGTIAEGNHGHSLANSGSSGFMSSALWNKLDDIDPDADNYGSWSFRVNGSNNLAVQSGAIVNLVAGSNITLSTSGTGTVTIASDAATNSYLESITDLGSGAFRFNVTGQSNPTLNISSYVTGYTDAFNSATYNNGNWDTAFSWGDHAGLYVSDFAVNGNSMDGITNIRFLPSGEVTVDATVTGSFIDVTIGATFTNSYLDEINYLGDGVWEFRLDDNSVVDFGMDISTYVTGLDVSTFNNDAGYYNSGDNVSFGTGSFSGAITRLGNTVWDAGNLANPIEDGDISFDGTSLSGGQLWKWLSGTDITVSKSGTEYTISYTGSGGGGVVDELRDDSGTSVSNSFVQLLGGTSIGTQATPGASITINYTGSSDSDLKTNWEAIAEGSVHERFMALQAGTYEWVDDRYKTVKYNPGGKSMGMIAQEFIKQFPELGTQSNNLFGIDYPMYAGSVLTSELQHAHHRLDSHQEEIDSLKTQIATLQSKVQALEDAA